MTTTSTASAELPDVDRRAIQTGTIFAASFFAADIVMHGLRITKDGIIYDGQEVKDAGAVHAALMEVLVRGAPLPHRAQPEGGPPQAAANRAVIEEAAQVLESAAAHNRAKGRTVLEWTQQDRAERLRAILAQPAASLSPLCGAQPAESRKETAQLSIGFANNDQGVHVSVMQQHAGGAVTLLHQSKVPAGDSFTRFAVAAQQAAAPTWGAVHTVGDMVRNLLTLDQAAPIFTAYHVTIDGERRCRTREVTISRERVVDGKWIDSNRKDVPYTHIIWAKPDEPARQAAAPRTLFSY